MGSFDWVALAAFIFSVYNMYRGRQFARKQEDLTDVKNALSKVQLQLEKIRVLEMYKADFGARFVKEGASKKLVITNKGKAEARNVTLTFTEGPYFVINQEVSSKFPMTSMDSMSSVRLLATSSLGRTEVKEKFVVGWVDDSGVHNKTFDIPVY